MQLLIKNYQIISLLPVVYKIFERLVMSQIQGELKKKILKKRKDLLLEQKKIESSLLGFIVNSMIRYDKIICCLRYQVPLNANKL